MLRATTFSWLAVFVATAAFTALTSSAQAQNVFRINDATVEFELGDPPPTIQIPVLANVDETFYGFSVSLEYDRNKITIDSVELGSATSAVLRDVLGNASTRCTE